MGQRLQKERERESERERRNVARLGTSAGLSLSLDCRRADRLSRFHGRSFALLTAGRDRQTRTAATSAILCQESEERERKKEVTRARTRVNQCSRADTYWLPFVRTYVCVYIYIYIGCPEMDILGAASI